MPKVAAITIAPTKKQFEAAAATGKRSNSAATANRDNINERASNANAQATSKQTVVGGKR